MKPTSLHPVRRSHLKTTTVLPIALGAGVAALAVTFADGSITLRLAGAASVISPEATLPEPVARDVHLVACNPCNPCNPCAAANPCNPCAAAQPANPCAANPCNPCAAAAGPCSPCNPCNPCNPCAAAAGGGTGCFVPRLQTAAANPCNPCAAANPCNPCAAANPCSPCAAANPCNPCAAANPCNPCAAANPCNPCAAANPCNPCGAAQAVELTDAEAADVYDCVREHMEAAYRPADDPAASSFLGWTNFSLVPYVSATHGSRYVMNYANPAASDAYARFEEVDEVPAGGVIAKNSFMVGKNGQAMVGPLFLMEKMSPGFDAQTGDWKYSMIMADGSTFGVTNGTNSAGVQFCNECHAAVAEQDYLYFLPEDYRARKG